ncbi:zinc finger protein 474-like isoform X2 [Uloborus diversus]|uniref:zinc finger protein 474-like isoform X2 n=1 Tax=Uloborus diversus TaxID=327109 RepID=UPI002409C9E6|nr:zinc finger protein 474-like isoform X2 [Uloborus diversus]
MGPKSFVACYICFKEFGTSSIPFHEPKCLERWRASNRNLPVDKRTTTPVKSSGWKHSQASTWVCSHCQVSNPVAKGEKNNSCLQKKCESCSLLNNSGPFNRMTGVVKSDYSSPKKGKENKNFSNHIPTSNVSKKNAKNASKTDAKELETSKGEDVSDQTAQKTEDSSENVDPKSEEVVNSTSKRSIRPQTKILRRPTPNLKHPVIQVDSDDSSGDSSSSDKGKEDNPKRLKMGNDVNESSPKPKNFIMYNKYNVEKNIKNGSKERTSATSPSSIPNPCNSCNRSQAPERLHSHAKRDARGLMHRKSPSLDIKMASPQKKVLDAIDRDKVKNKELKSSVPESVKKEKNVEKPLTRLKEESDSVSDKELSIEESKMPEEELVEQVNKCYICQKEFKVSSLLLHESKCLENWKKANNSLNPNLRQLPPRRTEGVDFPDDSNPAWVAVQSQLVPCPLCSRTFFPERLPVHRRVCKGKQSPRLLKRASSLREKSASSTDGEEPKPVVYLPCYVCGRNYGSWVLPMHEQQCIRKWRRENNKLPDDEKEDEPQKVTTQEEDVASLIELGDNAWESHLQQLVPCPQCSRTFFPDRLKVHERSCKGPSPVARRPRSNKGG